MKNVKQFESFINEAKLELDAMDPKDKQLLKDLKKNKIKHKVNWNGTAVGFHTMELEGDEKKLKKVVDDHWGLGTWDDYKEYLEESSKIIEEGYSTEEKRIMMMAVRKIAKYMSVDEDTAMTYAAGALRELRDSKK